MSKKNKSEIIKQAVLKALVYADLFDYPLTADEVRRRLICKKYNCRDRSRPVPTMLDKLVERGKLSKQGEYYFLPGRKKIVSLRRKRNKISREKLKKAEKYSRWLKIIPTVKLVGLTGSAAAENAAQADDLDFLVITSSGWLWTTRFLATLLFSLLRLRRNPGDECYENKVCLNLFLSADNLDAFNHNLFIAHEIYNLKVLWDRNRMYKRFLTANSWVKNYLPNAFNKLEADLRIDYYARSAIIINKIIGLIDRFFFELQKWWMKGKKTTEKVRPDLIAFHPTDSSEAVLKKYNRKLKKSN